MFITKLAIHSSHNMPLKLLDEILIHQHYYATKLLRIYSSTLLHFSTIIKIQDSKNVYSS